MPSAAETNPDQTAARLLARAEQDPRVLRYLLKRLRAAGHLGEYLDHAYNDGVRTAWEQAFHRGINYHRNGPVDLPPRGQRARAAEAFLHRELADGREIAAKELERRALSEGISIRTLERVRGPIAESFVRVKDGHRASYWRLRT